MANICTAAELLDKLDKHDKYRKSQQGGVQLDLGDYDVARIVLGSIDLADAKLANVDLRYSSLYGGLTSRDLIYHIVILLIVYFKMQFLLIVTSS